MGKIFQERKTESESGGLFFFQILFYRLPKMTKNIFLLHAMQFPISSPILAFTLICPCSITTIERKSARATG
jgi:hypothetical protein